MGPSAVRAAPNLPLAVSGDEPANQMILTHKTLVTHRALAMEAGPRSVATRAPVQVNKSLILTGVGRGLDGLTGL